MITTAAKAGFYRAANGVNYPKIQILTVEGLLAGTERPEYIDYNRGEDGYKKAPLEQQHDQQQPLL